MNIKRITSALLGMPLVILILVFGNVYVVDIAFAIIAAVSLHEFYKAFEKVAKPVIWVGYIAALFIATIHINFHQNKLEIIGMTVFTIILLLFIEVFRTKQKTTITDISVTLFGISYIAVFMMFLPIIRGLQDGALLIWYVFATSWGTDTFAYIVGKTIGKHKFSKISPNKTIEGCIGGIIGAVIFTISFTFIFNQFLETNFSYQSVTLIAIILSIIGQIGDFAASSIKRYVGIKDFSNLIPGHGGMLDRFDSVIFIAPVAYFLLTHI